MAAVSPTDPCPVSARGWLVPDARVVVEIAQRERLDPPPGLDAEDERRYGAARFLFLRPESVDD